MYRRRDTTIIMIGNANKPSNRLRTNSNRLRINSNRPPINISSNRLRINSNRPPIKSSKKLRIALASEPRKRNVPLPPIAPASKLPQRNVPALTRLVNEPTTSAQKKLAEQEMDIPTTESTSDGTKTGKINSDFSFEFSKKALPSRAFFLLFSGA